MRHALAFPVQLSPLLETFNLTNNFNWGDPALNLNQAQFGRIQTMAGAPRIMQFGIKYGF